MKNAPTESVGCNMGRKCLDIYRKFHTVIQDFKLPYMRSDIGFFFSVSDNEETS